MKKIIYLIGLILLAVFLAIIIYNPKSTINSSESNTEKNETKE